MKKYLLLILLLSLLVFYSCKKEEVIVNYQVIEYDKDSDEIKNIKVLDDLINLVSKEVKTYSVGLKCTHTSGLFNNTGTGSGVIIKKNNNDYYVITNRHVVFNSTTTLCDDIKIYYDGLEIEAEVVKYDNDNDLALVKFTSDINFKACNLSEELELGSYVICCSSPYDLVKYFNTITVGNISSVERIVKEDNKDLSYFQHTCSINVGSSGGGIFNLSGELVGINDWMVVNNSKGVERIGMGIKSSLIKESFKEYL